MKYISVGPMVCMYVPPYTKDVYIVPIMQAGKQVREATDNYGDIECPFCDGVIGVPGDTLTLGDSHRCKAVIIGFHNQITGQPV